MKPTARPLKVLKILNFHKSVDTLFVDMASISEMNFRFSIRTYTAAHPENQQEHQTLFKESHMLCWSLTHGSRCTFSHYCPIESWQLFSKSQQIINGGQDMTKEKKNIIRCSQILFADKHKWKHFYPPPPPYPWAFFLQLSWEAGTIKHSTLLGGVNWS